MATTEHDVLLSNIDESGNVQLIYPVTKGANVVGAVEDSAMLDGKPASEFVQTANVVNNFTTTEAGYAADARTVAELNSNIATHQPITITGAYGSATAVKAGNVVTLSIGTQTGVFGSWTAITLFKLPEGYRPAIDFNAYTLVGDSYIPFNSSLAIKPNGDVTFVCTAGQTAIMDVAYTFVAG